MKKRRLLSALLLCCAICVPNFAESRISNPAGETETITQNMSGNSGTYGGAVYNEGTINIDSGIEFSNNYINAESGGGAAIYNQGGSVITGEAVKFINNGINNKEFGEITVNGSAGGAIASWNGGTVNIGKNSEFAGNGKNSQGQATWGFGGAIYIDGNKIGDDGQVIIGKYGSLTIDDGAKFTNNIATGAGAIYTGVDATIGKSEFSGNRAEGHLGGAIYAFGGYDDQIEVKIDTSTFSTNYSGTDGGAIANLYSVNTTVADGSEFTNNEAARNGGAIANRGYINSDGEFVAEITAHGNFEGNKAGVNGGAVYNTVDYAATKEDKQTYGKAYISGTFTNNSAKQNGGAIYNDAHMEITNATFSENKAAVGGAVYNTADAALAMENVKFDLGSTNAKNDIYNDGAITTSGRNTFANNLSGTGSIANSGINTFSGDNSKYSGAYSHSDANAVTTVTGTFFGGDSYEFDKGTLNWDTQKDYDGKLTVSGGKLNIGETQKGVLTLKEGSSIAAPVETAIKEGSTLKILGGEATLNDTDKWEGQIVLGTKGLENDTSSLTVGLANGSTIGKLEANNGKLNVLNGLNLDIGEGSYIKEAVAITTSGNINILDGGEVAINDNDILNGGAKVTLTTGGTLNYGKAADASAIIEANGGKLNLLENSQLTLTSGSKIVDAVALNIQKGAKLTLDNNLTLNLDNEDTWNGKIVNQNGVINTNGVTKSSASASLVQGAGDGKLNIFNDSRITLGSNSTIEGGEINITKGDNGSNGSVLTVVNANITGGDMTIDKDSAFIVKSGTFKLDTLTSSNLVDVMNNEINTSYIGTLTTDSQADFNIDIHARSNNYRSNDKFVVTNPIEGDGVVNINNWALQGDLYGWDAPIDRHIKLDNIFLDENGEALTTGITVTEQTTFTPIGWYKLNKNDKTEIVINPDTGLPEVDPATGLVKRNVIGSYYTLDLNKYNPQVFRGQVATVAQWMNQLNINDMLFTHSMVLPSFKDPDGGTMANKYAAESPVFAPYQYSRKDGGLWYKAYGTFENLQMNNGLSRVGNNAYGVLVGADFGLKELKNGWKFMPTAYIGYNGAHQTFGRMGQYQNGGQAGFLGTWYKNNFIVGALAYGGIYDNSMDVQGFSDNTFNYFGGAATKAAYNIRFHRDWVLQPNLFLSYNYFGQQNWHTNFGQMGMMAGDLNGVNIAPGINLIWEKETFSAYATLQYMYNINGAVGGRAGHVSLPHLEMERGYIQYGLGFTKKFTDRASGYLQAVLRNVGRTGVGFQMGFNFQLGK